MKPFTKKLQLFGLIICCININSNGFAMQNSSDIKNNDEEYTSISFRYKYLDGLVLQKYELSKYPIFNDFIAIQSNKDSQYYIDKMKKLTSSIKNFVNESRNYSDSINNTNKLNYMKNAFIGIFKDIITKIYEKYNKNHRASLQTLSLFEEYWRNKLFDIRSLKEETVDKMLRHFDKIVNKIANSEKLHDNQFYIYIPTTMGAKYNFCIDEELMYQYPILIEYEQDNDTFDGMDEKLYIEKRQSAANELSLEKNIIRSQSLLSELIAGCKQLNKNIRNESFQESNNDILVGFHYIFKNIITELINYKPANNTQNNEIISNETKQKLTNFKSNFSKKFNNITSQNDTSLDEVYNEFNEIFYPSKNFMKNFHPSDEIKT